MRHWMDASICITQRARINTPRTNTLISCLCGLVVTVLGFSALSQCTVSVSNFSLTEKSHSIPPPHTHTHPHTLSGTLMQMYPVIPLNKYHSPVDYPMLTNKGAPHPIGHARQCSTGPIGPINRVHDCATGTTDLTVFRIRHLENHMVHHMHDMTDKTSPMWSSDCHRRRGSNLDLRHWKVFFAAKSKSQQL